MFHAGKNQCRSISKRVRAVSWQQTLKAKQQEAHKALRTKRVTASAGEETPQLQAVRTLLGRS